MTCTSLDCWAPLISSFSAPSTSWSWSFVIKLRSSSLNRLAQALVTGPVGTLYHSPWAFVITSSSYLRHNFLRFGVFKHRSRVPLYPYWNNMLPSRKYFLAIRLTWYASFESLGGVLSMRYSMYIVRQSSETTTVRASSDENVFWQLEQIACNESIYFSSWANSNIFAVIDDANQQCGPSRT